jgi:hypothetical protein
VADSVRTPAVVLQQLAAEIDGLARELDPTRIVRVAVASAFVDRVPDCRAALRRVVRAGREDGAVTSGIYASILLGIDDFRTGQWDDAKRSIDTGLGSVIHLMKMADLPMATRCYPWPRVQSTPFSRPDVATTTRHGR